MVRWTKHVAMGVVALLGLALAMTPQHVALADGPQPLKVRVEITDGGFNGNADDFVINAEQGQLVEITFVFAQTKNMDDEHIFVLDGYKLESDKINSSQKETTLKFVADKPGAFSLKCDMQCEIHNKLQKGYLKVGGGGGSAALTPTTLSLVPSASSTGGETVHLTAVLKDAKGAPVPKADVRFFVDAEFAGAKGKMDIGMGKTNPSGVALLDFNPTLHVQQYPLTARFEGMGVYAESQQTLTLQATGAPPSAYVMEPVGLVGVPAWLNPVTVQVADRPVIHQILGHWATFSLTVVVLAIWATLGFVLFQAFSVARIRQRR